MVGTILWFTLNSSWKRGFILPIELFLLSSTLNSLKFIIPKAQTHQEGQAGLSQPQHSLGSFHSGAELWNGIMEQPEWEGSHGDHRAQSLCTPKNHTTTHGNILEEAEAFLLQNESSDLGWARKPEFSWSLHSAWRFVNFSQSHFGTEAAEGAAAWLPPVTIPFRNYVNTKSQTCLQQQTPRPSSTGVRSSD